MVPRYVANEAARRLQAELCSWGAEWRVAELPGASEPREEARRRRETERELSCAWSCPGSLRQGTG